MGGIEAGSGEGGSLGFVSLVSGVAALVGVLVIGQASYGWISGFDPAGWLRIVGGWMIPLGFLAALMTGVLSLRWRRVRGLGVAGIVIALIALGIFITMIVTTPS